MKRTNFITPGHNTRVWCDDKETRSIDCARGEWGKNRSICGYIKLGSSSKRQNEYNGKLYANDSMHRGTSWWNDELNSQWTVFLIILGNFRKMWDHDKPRKWTDLNDTHFLSRRPAGTGCPSLRESGRWKFVNLEVVWNTKANPFCCNRFSQCGNHFPCSTKTSSSVFQRDKPLSQ